MLYNPNWNVKTLFTWDNLIAWLEKQPASKEYCSDDAGNCLLAQWVLSIDPSSNRENMPGDSSSYDYMVFGQLVYLGKFSLIVHSGMGNRSTFANALQRARIACIEILNV